MFSMLRKNAKQTRAKNYRLDLKIQVPKMVRKGTHHSAGLYILKFEFIGNYSSFNIICPCRRVSILFISCREQNKNEHKINNHERHEPDKWKASTTLKPAYGFELNH
jgi:hypothetical protein